MHRHILLTISLKSAGTKYLIVTFVKDYITKCEASMPWADGYGGFYARGETLGSPVPQAGRVLFVTPEVAGLLKAGGLGEISAHLPRMLRQVGVDVRILLPGYPAALANLDNLPPGPIHILSITSAMATCRASGATQSIFGRCSV